MPNPLDAVEFEPVEPPPNVESTARQESDQLENRQPEPHPNSVFINLGRLGHVRWHAESGAPLFCFMSILVLLLFGVIVAVVAAWNSDVTWPDEVFKFLGQAVLTLVGAVVGASASSSTARPRRNPPPRP